MISHNRTFGESFCSVEIYEDLSREILIDESLLTLNVHKTVISLTDYAPLVKIITGRGVVAKHHQTSCACEGHIDG